MPNQEVDCTCSPSQEKSSLIMANVRLPSACDLILRCKGEQVLAVEARVLRHATKNPPFIEIIEAALSERSGAALAVLDVPQDDKDAWGCCWQLLQNSRTLPQEHLTNLTGGIRLAHKYELMSVLSMLDHLIVTSLLSKGLFSVPYELSAMPFKATTHHQFIADYFSITCNLTLAMNILESLHDCGLQTAYTVAFSVWINNNTHRVEAMRQEMMNNEGCNQFPQVMKDLLSWFMEQFDLRHSCPNPSCLNGRWSRRRARKRVRARSPTPPLNIYDHQPDEYFGPEEDYESSASEDYGYDSDGIIHEMDEDGPNFNDGASSLDEQSEESDDHSEDQDSDYQDPEDMYGSDDEPSTASYSNSDSDLE